MHDRRLTLQFAIFTILTLMSTASVGQTLEEVIAAQQIDTILWSGPKDNRINFAIQNRSQPNGQNYADRAEFVQLYQDFLLTTFTPGHTLEKSPYAQYRDFFNLYAFWWPNALHDNNGWNFQLLHGVRDHYFLPWENNSTGWITFFSTTRHGGGGGAGLERPLRVGSGKMFGMEWETLLHEFGHTMPGQLDEYTSSGIWSNGACWDTPNTTPAEKLEDVPWRKWIDDDTPIPTPYEKDYLNVIGAFEGGLTNFYGCYRPTARGCIMGAGGFGEDFGQGLCGPCVQRIICYLYEYVNPIENALPAEQSLEISGDTTMHFSVDVVHPTPNTQQYAWTLNGSIVARDVLELDVTLGVCDSYELRFTLLDTNDLIRYDPMFEHIYPRPFKEHVWNIDQTDVNGSDLVLAVETTSVNCLNVPTGMILPVTSGGMAPYTYRVTGVEGDASLSALTPGHWTVFATDANGCGTSAQAVIDAETLLDARIIASYANDTWSLEVISENYETDDLGYTWSTNNSGTNTISVTDDGTYSVDVTTQTGCTKRLEIQLVRPEADLAMDYTSAHSQLEKPSGRIYAEVFGGRPAYQMEWWDRPFADLTTPDPAKAIASGTTWDHLPEYAYDDNLFTKWLHFTPDPEDGIPWIGYQFEEPTSINYYVITSADDVPERDPKDWLFQGSMDGVDWVTLDAQNDQLFPARFEDHTYPIDHQNSYLMYRLYVTANHGDGATQLQELSLFGGSGSFEKADVPADATSRQGLHPGSYLVRAIDENASNVEQVIDIGFAAENLDDRIVVVQNGNYSMKVKTPLPDRRYLWFGDAEATILIAEGEEFQPPASGNFYVASLDVMEGAMSQISGFAVKLADPPAVDTSSHDNLSISNPLPEHEYFWYSAQSGGEPVHSGTTFDPGKTEGYYYAVARPAFSYPDPVDPRSIDGRLLQMDASDLDGDGSIDDPAPGTSSMLQWYFPDGQNHWSFTDYFAYEALAQNGLGVAEFATLWLQRIDTGVRDYQTILMVYEEDELSFPHRGPFEALSYHMPRHSDSTRLFSDQAPATTLNGKTYLNGQVVDPLSTANPMEFCVLGTILEKQSDRDFFYTDTHWEGRVGELLVWDRPLTDEEMIGASEHLRRKWISTADLESARTPVYWNGTTVSVEPKEKSSRLYHLVVAPNPVSRHGSVIANLPPGEEATVALYHSTGSQIFSTKVNGSQTQIELSDVLSRMADGTYFTIMRSNGQIRAIGKVVVVH